MISSMQLHLSFLPFLLLPASFMAFTYPAHSAPDSKPQRHSRIPEDTPLEAVKWTDGFWQDRMERLRSIYLPGVIDGSFMSEANGSTFRNFLRAAGKEEGGAIGRFWSDGDCYLVLDTVARLYAYDPDDYLKSKLDYWIPIIASIQREDGLVDSFTTLGDFDSGEGQRWWGYGEEGQKGRVKGAPLEGLIYYNMSHMFVAANTCLLATGDDAFLKVGKRAMDYSRNTTKESIQTGMGMRAAALLYKQTGEQAYLDWLTSGFEGDSPSGPPLREAVEIFGHNTGAAHRLIGATNFCDLTGESEMRIALERLAENLLTKKAYITGAVAPVMRGRRPEQVINGVTYPEVDYLEAVGEAYDLPSDSSYCETCGQCLFMEWMYSMFRLTGKAVYMNAAERMLYNSVLGTVDLESPNFFYANPQEQVSTSIRSDATQLHGGGMLSHMTWKRMNRLNCVCCPPKTMRALAMSAEIAYNTNGEGLWVNLYGSNSAKLALASGGTVECNQTTNYPWDGSIRLVLEKVDTAQPFSVFLRIPEWVDGPVRIAVNGHPIETSPESGTYHAIEREWKSGDTIELELPMNVRLMASHPKVKDNRGKVAVMRGPVVYCLETDDVPEGLDMEKILIPSGVKLEPKASEELGGVVKMAGTMIFSERAKAAPERLLEDDEESALYRPARFAAESSDLEDGDRQVEVSLIPYYARLNRNSNYFRVWLPVY